MRYPEFLKHGGKIGFIAPSFGSVMEPYHTMFENALKKFHNMGFSTVLGPNVYEDKGIGKSNTAQKCGEEINEYFLNDKCDILISCGGGETMCEDLPYVDFEGIAKAKPKWYMGYSDNTNLTFTLPVLCDTAAVYGPCAAAFGMEPWHPAISDAFDLLMGKSLTAHNYDLWEKEDLETENLLAPYHVTEPFAMKIQTPDGSDKADFSGRLIGGCLDCLTVLCGTAFDKAAEFAEKYAGDGIIWFMEACEMNPLDIRRAIWQLDQAGWFKNVKGFILGRPMMIDADGMGLDRFSAVSGVLDKYNVPMLFDVDLGHLPPMMPVISGALCHVRAENNALSLSYSLK